MMVEDQSSSLYNSDTFDMPTSGCGKREAHINWSMVIPEKAAAFVTGITLSRTTGPVPADSERRHQYAIA